MNDVKKNFFEVVNKRRSTRNFKPDPLPEQLIDEIVSAGRLAPSGNNNQSTHFIVITSQEKLEELRNVVTNVLANTVEREGMPAPLIGLISRAKSGTVDVNYAAPVLIITANKKDYGNAMADCSCALENMMLAAAACGIGSCWINQYALFSKVPPMRSYLEQLGLAQDEDIYGALVLGYTDKLETVPLPRSGNPVTKVK